VRLQAGKDRRNLLKLAGGGKLQGSRNALCSHSPTLLPIHVNEDSPDGGARTLSLMPTALRAFGERLIALNRMSSVTEGKTATSSLNEG
jgi:hypothetical protein